MRLKVDNRLSWLTVVKSQQVPTGDVPSEVEIQVGPWFGKKNVMVIPFDYYDFVVGLKFLNRINSL